jgi:UPF0755 protein
VRSSLLFRAVVSLVFRGENDAVAGNYFFEKPLSLFEVSRRILNGTLAINPIKITIPEGLNKTETAALIKKSIPSFDSESFVKKAKEGYVFPDTYFFPEQVSVNDVVRITRENFDWKTKSLNKQFAASGRSVSDIIKLASILELEANQTETRKIISGILWKRLDIKMPLQVDVSFKYINGKKGFELTTNDLKIDSPYNSYRYAGLPPTPISNPGLSAIEAAAAPEITKYFYYISDKSGVMHYAANFEEHKRNRVRYLNK